MPIVEGDWAINATTKAITYIGDDHGGASPSYATVIEFHRFLQDKADDPIFAGDDELDISIVTPSDRSTDQIITLLNGFFIDDNAAEHLYLGSIIQLGGDTIYDGLNVIGASPNIQIIQDGEVIADDWWNSNGGLNPDTGNGISHRFMLKVREFGVDIDGRRIIATSRNFGQTYGEFAINGTQRGLNVIALSESTDLNNQTAIGTVAGWNDIVNDVEGYNGIDADGNAANEFYYSNWEYGSRGPNDFFERGKWLQRQGSASTLYGLNGELFRGITHQIPYDALSGTFDEGQDLVWGTLVPLDEQQASGLTVGLYYDFDGGATGKLLAFDDEAGVTGNAIFALTPGSPVPLDNEAFVPSDFLNNPVNGARVNGTVTDGTVGGGKGRILADDGSGVVWIQLLQGVPPVDNLQLWEVSPAGVFDTATSNNALTNGSPVSRTVATPFVGQSTGSAIIGAYGLGIGADDLGTNDRVTALDNITRQPPNNVTFTVNGLKSGQDRVIVTADAAGDIDKDQMTIATTALTAANITSVEVNSIPGGTPSSGTIRVVDNNGQDRRLVYTSFTGSTFTIDPAASEAPGGALANVADFDTVGANIGNNVYVSYIDALAEGALVSAGSFVIGVEYVIETSGTTDFVAIGAADNNPGTIFTATGAGAGTGDARESDTSLSFTSVYPGSDLPLFIRVRDGGPSPIRTFETTGSLTNAGGSTNAIRTSDA